MAYLHDHCSLIKLSHCSLPVHDLTQASELQRNHGRQFQKTPLHVLGITNHSIVPGATALCEISKGTCRYYCHF